MTTLHHLYHSLRAMPPGWWLAICFLSSFICGVVGYLIGDFNALCNECAHEDRWRNHPFASRN